MYSSNPTFKRWELKSKGQVIRSQDFNLGSTIALDYLLKLWPVKLILLPISAF